MNRRGFYLLSFLLALGLLTAVLVVNAARAASGNGALGNKVAVLIAFVDQPGPADEALIRAKGGDIKYTYTIVPAIAAAVPQVAIEGLEQNPRVTRVDLDLEIQIIDYKNELENTWGVAHIGGGLAHNEGYLGSGVRVAILDTGIFDHDDLNYDVACSDSTSYQSIYDGHGHGTHVAGTVAALRNGVGVVGVAPEATLCVFKVLSDDGGGSYSDVIKALEFILAYNEKNEFDPIRITNNSYGSSGDPGSAVKEAFDATYAAGVLHVAGAGNSGNPPGRGDNCIYPARWDSLIATAATQKDDSRASFSSTCNELELSAPGVTINSTSNDGGYREASGTSMASPHVAGTATLAWAANYSLTNAEIRGILVETAKPLGSKSQYGHGLVQAYEAAIASAELAPTETGNLSGKVTDIVDTEPIVGATVVLDGTNFKGTTNESGDYIITDIPIGKYQATASAEGYQSDSKEVNISNNTNTEKDFALQPLLTGTLTGAVTDASTSEPIAGARVVLDGTSFGATTDNNGKYTIEDIPVGDYTATASADWYETQSANVSIVENGDTVQNFSLQEKTEPGTVSVRISSGTDDVNWGCDFTENAREIYFGWDESCSDQLYSAGFLFKNVNIPAGANILSAYVEFVADGPYNNQVVVNLCVRTSGWDSSCENETSFVEWVISESWRSGMLVQTPDIGSVIQDIIKNDWNEGNQLIIIGDSQSAEKKRTSHRRVFAYERDPQSAAVLVVEFTRE
jgi:subtilisin family serine protease